MPPTLPSTIAATAARQDAQTAALGAPADASAASDAASASLLAHMKRLNAHLTALRALLPSALDTDRLKVSLAGGAGDASAANQVLALAALGAPADASAASDAATASIIALTKRLLGKTPALESGRTPVALASGATVALDATALSAIAAIAARLPALLDNGRLAVALESGDDLASVTTSRATVTTSAAQILSADSTRATAQVRNIGSQTLYYGPASVTASNGFPLEPGEFYLWPYTLELWAVTASSTTSAALLTTNY